MEVLDDDVVTVAVLVIKEEVVLPALSLKQPITSLTWEVIVDVPLRIELHMSLYMLFLLLCALKWLLW